MSLSPEQLQEQVIVLQARNTVLEADLKKTQFLFDRARTGNLNLDLVKENDGLKQTMKAQAEVNRTLLKNQTQALHSSNRHLVSENADLRNELHQLRINGSTKKKPSGLFKQKMLDPTAPLETITLTFVKMEFKRIRGKLHSDKWANLNDPDLSERLKELGQMFNKAEEENKNVRSTNPS